MALILRNGGSQSPDRWLRELRNNHRKGKDTEFVEEIRDIIKKKIENELTNIWQVQQGQTNKKVSADIKTSKEEKTFNDKVADAEKQYQEFKKLNIDCKEFGVMI
mgnify:CR=1 FL=1